MPNPLQSYQDFIGAGQSVMFAAGNLMLPNFMNLANVKYVISVSLPDDDSRYDERSRQAISQLRAFFGRPNFEKAYAGAKYTVYRNRTNLPRAFLSSAYEVLKDEREITARLSRPDFDPARVVLLYEQPGFSSALDSAPHGVEVVNYDCNTIALKADAAAPCLLVLSENYHPDWRAYVDGKPAQVLRAYHTFRAVPLQPGPHEIVFRYESLYYRTGTALTLAALLFLVGTLALAVIRRRRTHSPTTAPAQ
jgi:hypothetical protein